MERIERKRHANQRPFRFPNRIEENGASESHSIRWPVDQPSNDAFETAARHANHLSPPPLVQQHQQQQQQPEQRQWVRFPAAPQAESENEAESLSEHINFVKTESFVEPVASAVKRKDERPTASAAPTPTPSPPSLLHRNATNNYGIQIGHNDVDNGTSTVNQTAIVTNIEAVRPMIYIVAEHGKNTAKNSATNGIVSNNERRPCRALEALALPSINCPANTETAIIFDEHQVLASTQHHPAVPITANTIDAIADTPNVLFNAQMAINLTNTHVDREPNRYEAKRTEPQLFNGLPIIV